MLPIDCSGLTADIPCQHAGLMLACMQPENGTDTCTPYCIYELMADPEERHNLAGTRKDIHDELYALYLQRTSLYVPGDPPCKDCGGDKFCAAAAAYGGYTGPYGTLPDELKHYDV